MMTNNNVNRLTDQTAINQNEIIGFNVLHITINQIKSLSEQSWLIVEIYNAIALTTERKS
jgi:hypothetical protein